MDKPLKDAVKERMVELKMSVADLAAVTGISAGRIYKWYDEKRPANPKAPDASILKEWLESYKSSNPISTPRMNLEPTADAGNWSKIADANLLAQKNIAAMMAMLKERDEAIRQVNANLMQMPKEMLALTAKILEGQGGILSSVNRLAEKIEGGISHSKKTVPHAKH